MSETVMPQDGDTSRGSFTATRSLGFKSIVHGLLLQFRHCRVRMNQQEEVSAIRRSTNGGTENSPAQSDALALNTN